MSTAVIVQPSFRHQRAPEPGAVWIIKPLRHHTNDPIFLRTHMQHAAQNSGIQSERALPQSKAQNNNVIVSTGLIVLCIDRSSKQCFRSESRKKVSGNQRSRDLLWFAFTGQLEAPRPERRNVFARFRPLLKV